MRAVSKAMIVAMVFAGCGGSSSRTGGATHAGAAPNDAAPASDAAEPEQPTGPTEEMRHLYATFRDATRGGSRAGEAAGQLAGTTYQDPDVEMARSVCVRALSELAASDRGVEDPRLSMGGAAGRPPMVADNCITFLMIMGRRYNVVPPATRQPVDVTVDGELADGDPIVPQDRSFYDDYEVELEQGWTIEASMESEVFDTYLWLIGPDGRSVIQSDDIGTPNHGDTDSYFRVHVLESGSYLVRANSYDDSGRGAYRLRVRAGPMRLVP